jgi:hypothetical protein
MRWETSPRQAGSAWALVAEVPLAKDAGDSAWESQKGQARALSSSGSVSTDPEIRGSIEPHCKHVFVTGAFCAADASTPVGVNQPENSTLAEEMEREKRWDFRDCCQDREWAER